MAAIDDGAIQAALISAVEALLPLEGITTLAKENETFEPEADSPYMVEALLPGEESPYGAGIEGIKIWQLDLYFPTHLGTVQANAAALTVKNTLSPYSSVLAGQNGHIDASQTGPGETEGGWYRKPVLITVRAYG